MMTPVPVNLLLTVTLEAQQWNSVLEGLGELKYKIAAPLVAALTEQLTRGAQAQATAITQPAVAEAKAGNGVDSHPWPGC
jgi:hypothetical protein